MTRVCAAVLFNVLLLFSQNLWAQCGNPINPVDAQATAIDQETKKIFEKTGNILDLLPKIQDESLIVPGKRAGIYEVGLTFVTLSTKVSITPLRQESRQQYIEILPEGYVPERKFSKAKKEQIEIAFTFDEPSVREVFVQDERYRTSEGIHVGSSTATLEKFSGIVSSKGEDGKVYYKGKGITFVALKNKIIEIIVIRQSAASQ